MTLTGLFAGIAEPETDLGGLPSAEVALAPGSIDELSVVLDRASEHDLKILVVGGGTHQGYGHRVEPDIVLSMSRMNRVVDWQPDDLTVTVEGGMGVAELETMLSERGQTAVLPETTGPATVGGALAAGVSGWRRARYGGTRERVLEVDLVTGDGRHVRAGGRVVKNVTGFDLPRLSVGSLGSLGVLAQACLKLWPLPSARATVTTTDGDIALSTAYRPQAVVETDGNTQVFLGGTEAEVEGQAAVLGGDTEDGWIWPAEPLDVFRWSIRVPPSQMRNAISRLGERWRYQAGLGTGEIRAASPDPGGAEEMRTWAESVGGSFVIVQAPPPFYAELDPWGTPPPGLDLQRRLVARFDPCRVVNPGRLPGRV